ncbi:MAG: WG repeat-containing protein [Oscillospiraceae bacterium]|jgi:hypothetical protein|nr:WG repeat-containing protein [Oscillospiraceae bacterium]
MRLCALLALPLLLAALPGCESLSGGHSPSFPALPSAPSDSPEPSRGTDETAAPGEPTVNFTSAAFEAAARKAIGKPAGGITPGDLAALDYLSLAGLGLQSADLEPLLAMPGLLSLDVSSNLITDTSILARMGGLIALNLLDNPIGRDDCDKLLAALPSCRVTFGDVPHSPLPDEPYTDEDGFMWLVPPRYDYDYIELCDCGRYKITARLGDGGFTHYVLSPLTGEIVSSVDDSHGNSSLYWLYDPKLRRYMYLVSDEDGDGSELFQFSAGEFTNFYYAYSKRFRVIRRADFSLVTPVIDPEGYISYYNYEDAFIDDLYALAFGSKILTGYEYPESDIDRRILHFYGNDGEPPLPFAAAVCKDGKWGMLNTAGKTFLPFVFDHIVSIDDNTAFAKKDGLYGILYIEK